jgi:hypothetical protein
MQAIERTATSGGAAAMVAIVMAMSVITAGTFASGRISRMSGWQADDKQSVDDAEQ